MNFSYDGKVKSRNYTGIAIVVALHILLIYALIKGLAHKKVDIIEQPVETTIIKEIVPPPPPKKPDPPKIIKNTPLPPPPPVAPPVFVPKVEVPIATPTPTVVTVSTPPAPAPTVAAPVGVAAAPVSTHTGVSTGSRSGCGTPKYPEQAREDEEQGVTRLALLIGPDGKVSSAKVDKSSGHGDLDKAALTALSLCVFKPATTDGQPVEAWTKIEWSWTLE